MSMRDVSPTDVDYWCPVGTSSGLHFHAAPGGGACMNCGAPVYDADDGTNRWKRQRYIISEEQDPW